LVELGDIVGVLAKRYAKAFFAKASESKEERLLISELLVLGTIFNQSDVKTVLSKRFAIEEQKAFFTGFIFKIGELVPYSKIGFVFAAKRTYRNSCRNLRQTTADA